MNIWIELATVAVELFLPWYFFSGMLGKSSSPRVLKILTGIIYGAALSALSLFVQSSPTRSAAIIILTFLAAKIYYRRSWLTTIYPTVLFFLFAILSDILCGTLLQLSGIPPEELMGDGIARLIYNIFGKLIHLICLYIILIVVKAPSDMRSILKALPLLSCQLLSIYICQQNYLIVIQNDGPSFIRFETLSLLYINLIMCAFVDTLNRSHEREKEAEEAKQQLTLQKNYYLDILERQEETRSLWHDIKKYMASMEALVASENKQEAQQCLDRLQFVFSDIINSVDTGNTLIDSILNYGMKKASEVGVRLQPEIWVDKEIRFPAADLFVIIGNTLDNAIEACSLLGEEADKVVSICLHQKNHLLLYEIENHYSNEKPHKAGKIHGYGLKNVEACVKRNDGLMSVAKEGGIFKVSIQLSLGE